MVNLGEWNVGQVMEGRDAILWLYVGVCLAIVVMVGAKQIQGKMDQYRYQIRSDMREVLSSVQWAKAQEANANPS